MHSQKSPPTGHFAPPALRHLLARCPSSQTGWRRNCPWGLKKSNLCYLSTCWMCWLWWKFPTVFKISVLSRSFMSMLKASSFNCGPRLQDIVIHARPGRSQSFNKMWNRAEESLWETEVCWLKKKRIPTESYYQWPTGGQSATRGPYIYHHSAPRFGKEGKYGVEDALFVLGDGAGCRVPVWCAVTSAVGHLKQSRSG